jgi:hypothetical protein
VGAILVAFSFTGFSGLEDSLVASGKDGLFFTGKFVSWGAVADRRVKAHSVVVFDEASDQATGVLEIQGDRMQSLLRDLWQRSIFPLL